MTFEKSVMGIVPGVMALGVLGKSVQMVPKNWGPKGVKKVGTKDMISGFVPIIAGTVMIKPVADMVSVL